MKYKVSRGKPIYGVTFQKTGVNFGIFSKHAKSIKLHLYKNFDDIKPFAVIDFNPKVNKTGDIWHIFVEDLAANTYYAYKVEGPFDITKGHRFDKTRLLIDPYAKAISGHYNFEESEGHSNGECKLNYSQEIKGIIIDDTSYDWEEDEHPRTQLQDSIIYEMHISLFTMNPNSKVENRGTYKGVLEKIAHLKELGITAVELLPIFEFNKNELINTNPFTGELLRNIWGYNPIGFFAPTANYISGNQKIGMSLGNQVFEFKDFVKALHKEGIEIILDVVFNHTGEGNENGPTFSFKGFDNSIYYILEENREYFANYSGTGNTLNCSHAVVKELIIDSLRYWVTEMHIDGFRFDLAAILGRANDGRWIGDLSLLKDIADDPILSGTKLIAEGWDAAGGYFVGEFPSGWAEWNGKFRDTARKFIKGDMGQIKDLATRIVGSPDLFTKYGRKPYHSINFITAHDGFTMWDLVSYNEKHNYQNGENNCDGANDNYSWNHGVEGETRDIQINNLRKRQMKNFMLLLMISQGVPMILMGDEFARTQQGNNNAYCQDNELNWLDWGRKDKYSDIFNFTKKMINFRKKHHALKRPHFFLDKDKGFNGYGEISWHGLESFNADWAPYSRAIAFMISGKDYLYTNIPEDNDIYVVFNSHYESLEFELPYLEGKKWYRVVDTHLTHGHDFSDVPVEVKSKKYRVMDRSAIVLVSK